MTDVAGDDTVSSFAVCSHRCIGTNNRLNGGTIDRDP